MTRNPFEDEVVEFVNPYIEPCVTLEEDGPPTEPFELFSTLFLILFALAFTTGMILGIGQWLGDFTL